MQVVLPEGSSAIEAFAPLPSVQQSLETKYTYLDVFGRPVLVLRASNVVALTDDVLLVNYRSASLWVVKSMHGLQSACRLPFLILRAAQSLPQPLMAVCGRASPTVSIFTMCKLVMHIYLWLICLSGHGEPRLCDCRFNRMSLLLEPGLVILAFGTVIAALVFFARLDLSLDSGSGRQRGSSSGGSGDGSIPPAAPKELFAQLCNILAGERFGAHCCVTNGGSESSSFCSKAS